MFIFRLSFLFSTLLFLGQSTRAESFSVVVHKNNPVNELGKKEIADIFLKKVKFWRHGDVILPVDLVPASPVRQDFSEKILQRRPGAVRSYWQHMIFSGREVQPLEFMSENEVVDYILRNPGAIGYVSTKTDASLVKTIRIGSGS